MSAGDKAAPQLSVVIPAFNEELRLARTFDEIHEYLGLRFPRHEVIVVDDGSTDRTAAIVEERSARDWPELRLLRQPRNLGFGAAMRRGCLAATGELVLYMDADHAVPIENVERFIADVGEHSAEVVAGVRLFQSDEPKWRRVVGLLLQVFAHVVVFETSVVDVACGFKLFTRAAAQRVLPYCRTNGGMINVELFHLLQALRVRCYFDMVPWRNKEGSRIPYIRTMLSDPFRIVLIRLRRLTGGYRHPVLMTEQPWNRPTAT